MRYDSIPEIGVILIWMTLFVAFQSSSPFPRVCAYDRSADNSVITDGMTEITPLQSYRLITEFLPIES